MDIGILGGTGPAGKALAARLASVGMSVSIGSRSAERGEETASQLREKWASRKLDLHGAANETACEADVVVVATPWDGAAHTVAALASHLEGKVVVSMANALFKVAMTSRRSCRPRLAVRGRARRRPRALVSGAFHHLPARGLANLEVPLDADVLVCSDHPAATKATIEAGEPHPGLPRRRRRHLVGGCCHRGLHRRAHRVNIRHRAHASIRLTGLNSEGA